MAACTCLTGRTTTADCDDDVILAFGVCHLERLLDLIEIAPSSNTNFTEAAMAMNAIVGNAPRIPSKKLFMAFLTLPEANIPASGPKIRKYAVRITTA